MPMDSMSKNTPAANADSSTLYRADGSMRPRRKKALATKNAVTPSGMSRETGETAVLNSPNSGASDPMELTMKNVMASPTSVRKGTAAAMMSSNPGAVRSAGAHAACSMALRPPAASSAPFRVRGSTARETSGKSVASPLAARAGQARIAQHSSAATDAAHPASTMMAREPMRAYASNHDMMRMMAKKPEKASPAMRIAGNPAVAGNVHTNVPAAMNSAEAVTNGVRPTTEGSRRDPTMLARQATSPGSMDEAAACTAPGNPNAGDSRSTTAHAQRHA